MFAYELPQSLCDVNNQIAKLPLITKAEAAYNFHTITTQQRLFFLIKDVTVKSPNMRANKMRALGSIAELFLNAGWLEREAAEMSGLFFNFKKDLRNLLLPYGDSSAPLQKIFPTVGLKELYYDATADLIE